MRFISENWKNFLNERLLLKPGETGWDLYGKLVSDAYQRAESSPADAASWHALEEWIPKMFKRIVGLGTLDVQFVDEDPYVDDQDLRQKVKETGVLKVWRGGTSHPIWSAENNLKFRAIHDWMGHIQPKGDPSFGIQGEIASYNAHLHTIPPAARPAMFTEVIGQAASFTNTGEFPEQKIAVLPGFDFTNIGKVDGYDIVNKELVKRKSTLTETMFRNLRKHLTEDEGLYYGTSTVFQEQIALEGIKPPSLWGDFELAENKAQEVADDHGGDPMVIQVPKKQFNEHFFSKNEGLGDYIVYNENIVLGLEEIKREVL